MPDKAPSETFVRQIKQQLTFLRDEEYSYSEEKRGHRRLVLEGKKPTS